MIEIIKTYLENNNLENLIPYLENTTYLVIFFLILFILIFIILSFLFKSISKTKENESERKKPSLNEIVTKEEIKISDDNEFVDVLVAIEEEMSAVRELYVGGYISKGVYISETDRLYEKAKIFGL
tara:strand:+ start:319 stop:696 length:378 start_codon:yes stop_codon:yes gene_type:complete